MRTKFGKIKLFPVMISALFLLNACEYQSVVDASYPEQTIYLPIARTGIYSINNLSTENAPFRYEVDTLNKKLFIPIGIYRSGVNNKGDLVVNIQINNDTVLKLISDESLKASGSSSISILPEEEYALPATIQVEDGKENVIVKLAIELPFLLANPDKLFALGITISGKNVKVNPKLNTTVLLLDTKFIFPKPSFSYVVDSQDSTRTVFTNTSMFGVHYEWDFGDGSPVFSGVTPPAHTYDSLGIYAVKLRARGVTGSVVTLDSAIHLWKNVTKTYIPNPGNPFLRSDNRASKTGNLKDWSCTPNVQPGGFGGYYADIIPVMDFFSTLPLVNAKIYRSFDLPKGKYKAGFVNAGFRGANDCYFMVAVGDMLPDVEAIPNNPDVLASYRWNTDIMSSTNEIIFELAGTQRVTVGFLVNNSARSEVKIRSVFLYR